MKSKYLLLFLVFIYQASASFATEKYKFRTMSPDGGFYYDGIKAIEQDIEGFIWVMMDYELYRFDGYHYKKYYPYFASIAPTKRWIFNNIASDASGHLYVNTNNGLYRYKRISDRFEKIYDAVSQVKVDKAAAFRLKVYDKGKQCKLHEFENVLRIEIKAERNYLKKRGVRVPTLNDLLSTDVWQHFETILLDAVENITFAEATPSDGLTKKEHDLLELFTGDGWRVLDKFKRYRERKKYQALIKRLNITGIKEQLKSLIESECERLRDIDSRYRDGIFSVEDHNIKVSKHDKTPCNESSKTATETAYFRGMQKGQNRYQDGTWITSVLVAKTPTTDNRIKLDSEQVTVDTKISYTLESAAKNKGKPPDAIKFSGSG